jgi:hypothetical protein
MELKFINLIVVLRTPDVNPRSYFSFIPDPVSNIAKEKGGKVFFFPIFFKKIENYFIFEKVPTENSF